MNELDLSESDFQNRFFTSITMPDFLRTVFRRSRLFVKTESAGYYDSVFKRGDLSELLSGTMLHRPAVRMIGEGRVLPMSEISINIPYGKFEFENVVDIEKVKAWYHKGYTINVRGAHYNHQGLGTATSILSTIFDCNIRANLYLTPAGERGLQPHYDVHDVIIIQVSGSKQWTLYENNFDRPTKSLRFGQERFDVGGAVEVIDMMPGDALYLPRGFAHSATSLDESLHVTIGIEEVTIADVFRALANMTEMEPELRDSLDSSRVLHDENYRKEIIHVLRTVFTERLEGRYFDSAAKLARRCNFDRSPRRNVEFLNGH